MSCKHKTCVIQEEFICVSEVIVVDGQTESKNALDPFPTGKYFVRCYDCGLERTYTKCPKWLLAYLRRECRR